MTCSLEQHFQSTKTYKFHNTMPPKARGSMRARGGARGGATTGTAAASEAAPTTATEAPAEVVVPKQEDGDSKSVVTGEGAPTSIESQASPSVTASYVLSLAIHTGCNANVNITVLSHHLNLAQNPRLALLSRD
jgi:hypothetical protein